MQNKLTLTQEELNTLLAQAREEGRKEAVPEGWQIVPKEPTNEMLLAIALLKDWDFIGEDEYCAEMDAATDGFYQMLSAAPSHKHAPLRPA